MPLVDVRGFNLGGDQFDNATKGFDIGRKISQFDRERQIREILSTAQPSQQQNMLAEQSGQFGNENTGIPTQEDKIQQAKGIDPVIAEEMLQKLGFTDKLKRAEASRFASELQNTPFERRGDKINARAQSLQSQGRNNKDTLELLDLNEAEQNQAMQGVQMLDLSTKDRLSFQGVGEQSELRRQGFDLKLEDQKLRARENELRNLEREERLNKSKLGREKTREEIKVKKQAAKDKRRDLKFSVQDKINGAEEAISSIDSMLEGSGLESAAGVETVFPTIPGSNAANFEALLETLKSKIFLDKIKAMRGMGALSENEGKKIAAAAGALELSMSDEKLRSEIEKIRDTMKKGIIKSKERFKNILQPSAENVTTDELENMTIEELNDLKASIK